MVASTGADAATRRLAWLDGAARPLMSHYRQGFKFHSGWPMPGEKNYSRNVMQDAQLAAFEKVGLLS